MEGDKLGVAIHGAGNVARAHVASWLRNPHCHIASVGSRTRASAERLVREMGHPAWREGWGTRARAIDGVRFTIDGFVGNPLTASTRELQICHARPR